MKLRALKTFSDGTISVIHNHTYKMTYAEAAPYLAADILEHAERTQEADGLALALNRIDVDDDVYASIVDKAKTLHIMGHNPSSDSAIWETVTDNGGIEVELTTNGLTVIESTSASDTQTVTIEGHYLAANDDLVFHVQTATLTGTTPVTLAQPLARCSLMHSNAVATVGVVSVAEGTGGTIHCEILADHVQSEKCQMSTSYRDYFIITSYGSSILGGNNASVKFELDHREADEAWHPIAQWSLKGDNTDYQRDLNPPEVLHTNSELRIRAFSNTNGTEVDAHIAGYLAINEALKDAADPAPA